MSHMVSTAMGEDVTLMEGSHVKQKDTEIGKTPQDNSCFHEVKVQDSIDVCKVTLKTRKRGCSKSTKVVKCVNQREKRCNVQHPSMSIRYIMKKMWSHAMQ